MKRTTVKSSNIRSIGYDAPSGALHVEFASGDVYEYRGVSAVKHKALMAAKSKGGHFAEYIRDKHLSRKLF